MEFTYPLALGTVLSLYCASRRCASVEPSSPPNSSPHPYVPVPCRDAVPRGETGKGVCSTAIVADTHACHQREEARTQRSRWDQGRVVSRARVIARRQYAVSTHSLPPTYRGAVCLIRSEGD
jgi:hypothetical protein